MVNYRVAYIGTRRITHPILILQRLRAWIDKGQSKKWRAPQRETCAISLVFLVIMTFSPMATSARYLCVADQATGFKKDKNSERWETTRFRVDDAKYLISPSDREGAEYQVTPLGDDLAEAWCEDGFNDAGYLHCSGYSELKFNKGNGRYIYVYLLGYWPSGSTDTPYIEIGKCSPL